MPAEEIMRFIYISIIFLLLTSLVKAEKLTIYTYDSFVSEWGPGPIIKKKFKEIYQVDLNLIAVDSAATLLNKVILEGSNTNADIILGLDMNLLHSAKQSELFDYHYSNSVLMKLISGCSSDNVSGISLVKEKTLMKFFPQLIEREVTVEEIITEAKRLREERGKPLKSLDNIISGTTKEGALGSDFYQRNEELVTLDGRLLSEESKEIISDISNLPIDPEGRTKKNVLKMMMEDGFIEMIPGNEDGYINYLKPFMSLIKSEKKVAL